MSNNKHTLKHLKMYAKELGIVNSIVYNILVMDGNTKRRGRLWIKMGKFHTDLTNKKAVVSIGVFNMILEDFKVAVIPKELGV